MVLREELNQFLESRNEEHIPYALCGGMALAVSNLLRISDFNPTSCSLLSILLDESFRDRCDSGMRISGDGVPGELLQNRVLLSRDALEFQIQSHGTRSIDRRVIAI